MNDDDWYFVLSTISYLINLLICINSILAIIYLNEQVLNKQVLKPD